MMVIKQGTYYMKPFEKLKEMLEPHYLSDLSYIGYIKPICGNSFKIDGFVSGSSGFYEKNSFYIIEEYMIDKEKTKEEFPEYYL